MDKTGTKDAGSTGSLMEISKREREGHRCDQFSEDKIETMFRRENARVSRLLCRTYLKISYLAPAISREHANSSP